MTAPLLSDRLASRVTIVTGSSSGLGRAIALVFAANGAHPIICSDLRPDPRGTWGVSEASIPTHELICQRYGEGKAVYVQTDVTVAGDVEKVVQKAVQVAGRLDV
jgi:NAD(P)-dependent dehydrogenase (short-subunit alcohol dehydrogenase family)